MDPYQHVLIIGGTGMLRAASVALGASCQRMTSVARTKLSLRRVDGALRPDSGQHHQLQLDWSYPDSFIEKITEHTLRTELPDLVIAWIHDDPLTIRLASYLVKCGAPPRFFHVIGSASANPARIAGSLREDVTPQISAYYHQVILGAKGSGMKARWLTDQEISDGVLEAIKSQETQFVVGTLERYQSVNVVIR